MTNRQPYTEQVLPQKDIPKAVPYAEQSQVLKEEKTVDNSCGDIWGDTDTAVTYDPRQAQLHSLF